MKQETMHNVFITAIPAYQNRQDNIYIKPKNGKFFS
jgi:hypothetical protein